MTITDIKKYAESINAKISPTDKIQVVLKRASLTYIGAFLRDRKKSLEQSISDPKISAKKRDKKEFELAMVNDTIDAIYKSKLI